MTEVPYHRLGGALWFVQIWLFAYLLELSSADSFPSMSLGLSVAQSIRTIYTNSLSFFFLSLENRSLSQLYLKPNTISSLSWHQILSSSTPYLLDFKYPSSFLNTFYRVMIFRGCYAFFAQLSSYSGIFLPYLPHLSVWIYSVYPFIPFLALRTTY